MAMRYCKHLRWVDGLDADYYDCAIGFECSSDWCDDIPDDGKSDCDKFVDACVK